MWLDVLGLALVTTMLAFSQLDACESSNTHRTYSAWIFVFSSTLSIAYAKMATIN
jgi:hypothetical protein